MASETGSRGARGVETRRERRGEVAGGRGEPRRPAQVRRERQSSGSEIRSPLLQIFFPLTPLAAPPGGWAVACGPLLALPKCTARRAIV